ncbi:hypothetical protein ACL02U_29435 [Streptomyces sp. MS06]|uniref:hypothetical protein n=1 Tax=Streptomyces sp. MS06 TaxID=3385974 RepID=UPI00399F77FD
MTRAHEPEAQTGEAPEGPEESSPGTGRTAQSSAAQDSNGTIPEDAAPEEETEQAASWPGVS